MDKAQVRYVFRRPRFPVICDIEGELVAARSPAALQRRLAGLDLPHGHVFALVDASGEGWGLYTEWMAVSPLIGKKAWTKAEIIRLFNESANARRADLTYPGTSLSSKRLERVVGDIAALIEQTLGRHSAPPGRGHQTA